MCTLRLTRCAGFVPVQDVRLCCFVSIWVVNGESIPTYGDTDWYDSWISVSGSVCASIESISIPHCGECEELGVLLQ